MPRPYTATHPPSTQIAVPQQCMDISQACPTCEHPQRPIVEQTPEQHSLSSEQRRLRRMQRQEPR